jgi:hypothetical protein
MKTFEGYESESQIDEMEAGGLLDCLIAEKVLGWHRVQAPKFDYDGPLLLLAAQRRYTFQLLCPS